MSCSFLDLKIRTSQVGFRGRMLTHFLGIAEMRGKSREIRTLETLAGRTQPLPPGLEAKKRWNRVITQYHCIQYGSEPF
jgi:hypothetical protein